MSKSSNFVMFATGAVLGSVATWHFLKKKYERIAQEEIDSVKEAYRKKYTKDDDKVEQKSTIEISTTPAVVRFVGDPLIAEPKEKIITTEVITPDEFAEIEHYRVVSLTYFADDILADDDGVQYDIDKSVDRESLEHFGEYEDDVVHVRNYSLETDFEILLDLRKYSEVYTEGD